MTQALVPLLALALAAGQEAKLEITPPHATYGYHGARRPPGDGVLPGDIVHFTFNIKNLKYDAKGRASYSVAVEVLDSDGEVVFRQQPRNAIAQNYFGGNELPFSSSLSVPLTAKPGIQSWKITIADRMTEEKVTVSGKGKVRPADFGLVQVATFADREGRVPSSPNGAVGDTLYLNFAVVGFARDPKTKLPDVKARLRILDENKQPTFSQPLEGHIHEDVAAEQLIVPLQFGFTMNRVGRFTLELSVRDELSGKTDQAVLPVRVLDAE